MPCRQCCRRMRPSARSTSASACRRGPFLAAQATTLVGMSERRLVALISGQGKSQKQLKAQAREAIRLWQEATSTLPPRDAV